MCVLHARPSEGARGLRVGGGCEKANSSMRGDVRPWHSSLSTRRSCVNNAFCSSIPMACDAGERGAGGRVCSPHPPHHWIVTRMAGWSSPTGSPKRAEATELTNSITKKQNTVNKTNPPKKGPPTWDLGFVLLVSGHIEEVAAARNWARGASCAGDSMGYTRLMTHPASSPKSPRMVIYAASLLALASVAAGSAPPVNPRAVPLKLSVLSWNTHWQCGSDYIKGCRAAAATRLAALAKANLPAPGLGVARAVVSIEIEATSSTPIDFSATGLEGRWWVGPCVLTCVCVRPSAPLPPAPSSDSSGDSPHRAACTRTHPHPRRFALRVSYVSADLTSLPASPPSPPYPPYPQVASLRSTGAAPEPPARPATRWRCCSGPSSPCSAPTAAASAGSRAAGTKPTPGYGHFDIILRPFPRIFQRHPTPTRRVLRPTWCPC